MSLVIREGTLSECVVAMGAIPELLQAESEQGMRDRLGDSKHLILVAEENGQLLGFKIGYQLDTMTFYSWLGGVSNQARGKGVAQKLLDFQEAWVVNQGYRTLKVKSRNQFPAMVRLLMRNGYLIEKFEEMPDLIESRIYFTKAM